MYDFLKAFCNSNGIEFFYARRDFQNLYEDTPSVNPVVFLDPVAIESKRGDMGVLESSVYSGSFMIGLSSDIDEISYDDRYQKYIKPILINWISQLEEYLTCEFGAEFNQWRMIEIINAFDFNFDGISVNYNISINVD